MNQEQNFSSGDLIAFLWKKRKPLIIITSSAFVISIVVSLMMTPYYMARAVVFPTKSNSVDYNSNSRNSVVEFGDEADAERLLQVLVSPEIRDSLTIKYDLYKHYDIDPKQSHARYEFQKIYEGNVKFTAAYDFGGRIEINGTFRANGQFGNELCFEIITDQTYIQSTIVQMKQLIDKYGDDKGVFK